MNVNPVCMVKIQSSVTIVTQKLIILQACFSIGMMLCVW